MCILQIGLILVTAATCGMWADEAPAQSRGEVGIAVRRAAAGDIAVAAKTPGGLVAIKEGEATVPVRAIVVDLAAHPVEKAAARELQSYLVQMGGVKVPIVESAEAAPTAQGGIFVGHGKAAAALCQRAELAKLGR